MRIYVLAVTAMVFVAVSGPFALAQGDVKAGKKVFKKCASCHAIDSEKKKVGPSLQGVVNRGAAMIKGFKYSKAMKAAAEDGLIWDEANIEEYIKAPKKFLKGTKMAFAGLKKEKDIANVIAYIKEFSPEADTSEESQDAAKAE